MDFLLQTYQIQLSPQLVSFGASVILFNIG